MQISEKDFIYVANSLGKTNLDKANKEFITEKVKINPEEYEGKDNLVKLLHISTSAEIDFLIEDLKEGHV